MSHYFVDDPNLRSARKSFDYAFGNEHFTFTTDFGVFAKGHADFGTYLLLKYAMQHQLGDAILDLGCGYGVVGVILKRLLPQAHIDMVDVNSRAVELAKYNAAKNQCDVSAYLTEDIISLQKTYHSILFNPPIRAGKRVIYELYKKAHQILEKGGHLFLVVRRQHGAESHIQELKELFKDVSILGKEAGYWLLKADK